MAWLVLFSLFGLGGLILGIVGNGNALHFRDAHSVRSPIHLRRFSADFFFQILGLVIVIFILPTIIFTAIRLQTSIPHPSSSSFTSIKAFHALLKSPQRIYLISGKLIQILLVLGQVSSLQGFSTLRSITFCLTDAILSHTISAIVTSILLTLQIGAITLLVMRIWLERRMAFTQREPTLPSVPPKHSEKSKCKSKHKHKHKPNDSQTSITTFGFETKARPLDLVAPNRPARPATRDRPDMPHRRTEDYKGKEDIQISSPYNVRKEGSEVSPLVPAARWYNPKTAGYLENQARKDGAANVLGNGAFGDDLRTKVVPGGRGVIGQGPKVEGVTVGDLWPPMSSDGVSGSVGGRVNGKGKGKVFGGGVEG